MRRPEGCREAGQGVRRRDGDRCGERRPARQLGAVLCRGDGQGVAGLSARGRVDRPHARARAGVGGQPGRGRAARRDSSAASACREVLGRPAVRCAARLGRHRRQHGNHRPAGDVAVLPTRDPGPLRALTWPSGHRHRRPDRQPRHGVSARPRRSVCRGRAVDDRDRRARPGHRAGGREHRPARADDALLPRLPGRAAFDHALPTLRVRMANERALGLSFIYASQT